MSSLTSHLLAKNNIVSFYKFYSGQQCEIAYQPSSEEIEFLSLNMPVDLCVNEEKVTVAGRLTGSKEFLRRKVNKNLANKKHRNTLRIHNF